MRPDLLIDQLAELAGQRNQDALDACFLDLFEDLLDPGSVTIYRIGGEDLAPRWVAQRRDGLDGRGGLRQDAGRPPLQALPLHLEAWHTGEIRRHDASPELIVVPMGCHQATECLVELRSQRPLSPVEERLVTGVQRFHRHLRSLIEENERDSLTRLHNRKSFDETFGRMALQQQTRAADEQGLADDRRHSVKERKRCWLAVMDIDHFKRVNDVHGHLVGDQVLVAVSRLLRAAFRGCDRLYRFGGEEFVVLLHAPEASAAVVAFERLRESVEQASFPHIDSLTVSVGYTEVLASDSPTSAFERADQAVYHAKSNGRNRVVCHEELLRQGSFALDPGLGAALPV